MATIIQYVMVAIFTFFLFLRIVIIKRESMIYIVKAGDTIDKIAYETGASPEEISYDNQIHYPYALAIGQAVYIPEQSAKRPVIYVNGYVYPFISQDALSESCPYLTDLSVFSYGFTEEGILIAPALDDNWIIREAYNYNVRPVLTLTPFGLDGRFNNQLISAVINDEMSRMTLINSLLLLMEEKGYLGLDVDFEYILKDDRDAFSDFVRELSATMNANGYEVSVALAPKTSDSQVGLLYEGKDYQALGEAANHVLLMTYEWGYTYGPPMAVAPLGKVAEVVEYALTRIEPDKIDLGIPNYGYDWTLPYIRGISQARTIGNVEAVQLAILNNAEIKFDQVSKSPYFNYIKEGVEHEVWFEDVRSLQEKYGLIKYFGLRGCGYWQLMRFYRANFLLLSDEFVIKKQLESM